MTAPTVALVHSPFVGSSSWAAVARCLVESGESIVVANASAWTVGPPYYRSLASKVASQLGAGPSRVLLVGHSGAGGLLPSIAEAIGPRVRAAIFADAILPHPGRAWFESAPPALAARLEALAVGGELPTWDRWFPKAALNRLLPSAPIRQAFSAGLDTVPLEFCHEPAPSTSSWPPTGLAYLQLSEAYDDEARRARAEGWIVERDIIHHLAPVTHADRVAESLQGLIRALTPPA